jgi:hypothetical protein
VLEGVVSTSRAWTAGIDAVDEAQQRLEPPADDALVVGDRHANRDYGAALIIWRRCAAASITGPPTCGATLTRLR